MLKVLYLTNIPSPYRVDFFNELNKYCELTVAFERASASDRDESWYGEQFSFKTIFLRSKKIGNESSISVDIIKHLTRQYDFIVLGGYSTFTSMIASTYMKIRKIPYILNADGGFICENENRLKKLIKKHFVSSATYWLSTGRETSRYLIHYGARKENVYVYHFTSIKKSDLLSNIVSKDEKNAIREKLNIPYGKVILSVGQYIYRKGYDWMIESYRFLSENVGIYIVGGKPTEEYKRLKELYHMTNLHFIDFQNKESIKKWYQAADVFVLPTREDIWGLVINEALSQSLPVITTDKCIAGLELIDAKKNGFIIDNFDSKLLKLRTEEILNMEEDRYNEMCKISLHLIQDYTIEQMALDHYEIFKQIEKEETYE